MKLAVLGHTYVHAQNQAKYVELRRLDCDLELRLIVPRWSANDAFHLRYGVERHSDLTVGEVVAVGSAFARSHMTSVYHPIQLGRCLSAFQPDVIHIDEEPQAMLTVETVMLRAAVAPRAALTVFTWDNLLRSRAFPLGDAKRILRRFTLGRTDVLICGNRDAERLALREGHARRTAVLPQVGLEPKDHLPGADPAVRHQLGLEDAVVVGYAGRFLAEKGLRLVFDALAAIPDRPWKLRLVGGGPLESQILHEWIPRFPGRIVCIPPVSHAEVPRYLRAMDIFVLNSYEMPAWKEQFGLTLAQAMLLGRACVVSDSGALPEVAGGAAMVVAERSVAELREALEALLASPALRQTLGQRARERALRHYTNEQVAVRYHEVFERAVTARTGLRRSARNAGPNEAPYRAARR